MIVTVIVACDRGRTIGRDGGLPWRLSADLRRFKSLTMGRPIVMGRKTYESIGRPLPGRTSIVLTRQTDWSAPGVLVAHDFDAALALARDSAGSTSGGADELFVIGGADLFRLAWPRADRLQLTRVLADVPGDVRLDPWNEAEWTLVARTTGDADEKNDHPYAFETYERRPQGR